MRLWAALDSAFNGWSSCHEPVSTDIYSLGAILYELLTAKPPFQAQTPLETMRLVLEQDPKRPRTIKALIHPDLDTICMKCLEKNPAARYASAEALAEDLERWLRQEPIKARPAGPFLRAARWTKRNPVGTALILSLFIGLGAALFLLNLARNREQAAEQRRQVVIQQQSDIIRAGWDEPNVPIVRISSETLAVLGDAPPQEVGLESALRLAFAVNVTEAPVELATDYVPFLKQLEQDMRARLKRPVLFDLILCKGVAPEYELVARGKTDFQRIGALPYVLAKRLNSDVQPVVQEDVGKQAVIFVRCDLYEKAGVTNLSRLAGHSFAFGDTNSTVSFWAKVVLVRAGICGTNLTQWANINEYGSTAFTRRGTEWCSGLAPLWPSALSGARARTFLSAERLKIVQGGQECPRSFPCEEVH